MVFARIGYEDWYKPRKPKYINFKTKKSNLTGEILTIEKTFFYEIKLSDKQLNSFINDNDELSRKLLSTLILDSLSNLDTLSKKISDFEIEKFKADIRLFFQHQNLA